LEEIDGLASNAVSSLAYNAQYIIVGTNAGLTLLKRGWSPRHVEIRSFDVNSGLLSNEINGVDVDGNLLYLATANGLHRAQLTDFEKLHGHIPIYLTEVSVNQKNIPISSSLEVPFSDNNIQFDYFALSYRNRGKQTYRHRMSGIEDEWVVNQKTTAQYPYLPAGNYVFEVSVRNELGEWNPEPARIAITILKPYWAKTWFLVLISLIIIAVISLLFFWRIKVVNRRNKLLYDINWYQQEALINQMNPHFLFNSLNTIHRYVLQNDRMASSRYLTKFATLMRKTLDNSQDKFISIAKEVDALKLYLELESARFKDRFQFSIEVEPSIPQEKVMIPVFIIQPIVENAIWHGLMHSDKPGLIDIKFNRINGKNLVVSVRDNGIGREESEKIRASNKSNQRKSLGLAIIKRRIELINTQERSNIKITYNDLKNADRSCSGTEVIVHFPNFLTPYSNESFQSNSN
jgi:two-component sensor histidine kinase